MSSYPNSSSSTLSDSHARHLEASSAIDPAVSEERGTFTARRGRDVPQDGGKLPKKLGIIFPVHTLDGEIFHRLRPDNPGRLPKYLQPKGHPNRLDVHPSQHERIRQPGGMRYVTEGEKKVDAGVSHNVLMVGQSGVFNGQRDKGAALIDDWKLLPLAGEEYAICYDSDIETNESVQLAADRLARLLEAEGAKVFITLLPPAPDGSKQGLDDFFANGGTAKQLGLLTRPYDEAVVERARLTRDQRLRTALENLQRRFWSEEWKGMGGHSARDVALKLIEAARRHGRIHPDGIRVVKAQGPLALEARVSSRTLWKSLNRLEEMGFGYRDNAGRKREKTGAFVLRAKVSHYGERPTSDGTTARRGEDVVPGDLHLRAPRLMWSRPALTPKRGTVSGTRRVRESKAPEPRARIERLGKVRGAILDVLDDAGGKATLQEIAEALHRKRARDLRRRNLPWLEEAGILSVEGDTVALAEDWLERLEDARESGGELEAEELARKRYRDKSRAFHGRGRVVPDRHHANAGADGHVEDLRPAEDPPAPPSPEPGSPDVSPLAAAVRDYLDRCPHDARRSPYWIGATLWAHELHEGKPTPDETKAAIEELGGAEYLDETLRRARGAA
ncbi:MAG: DUF3854 domain-containing protein [Rubrobacter sp.]|nr:DUF3854 domain-containing protein [Rubrobacter sp.]